MFNKINCKMFKKHFTNRELQIIYLMHKAAASAIQPEDFSLVLFKIVFYLVVLGIEEVELLTINYLEAP